MRNLLTAPPPRDMLERFAQTLPGGVRSMLYQGSAEYAAYVEGKDLTDDDLLDLLVRRPNLLRKPLLTNGERFIISHKAEELESFFRSV